MECFIVQDSDVDLSSQTLTLRGDEARHAVRVLRISEGEHLMATTLNGFCYKATCFKSGQSGKNEWLCECHINEILPDHNEPGIDIQLIQGIPLQQSKFEEIIEKTTEIGISSIVPIYTKRTEKKTVNRLRLEKMLESGCKQAHRARKPILRDTCNFTVALDQATGDKRKIVLLHESAPLENLFPKVLQEIQYSKISLVVGPEGGFDDAEVGTASKSYDARIASLGPRRLRAETAAIMAVSIACLAV